MIRQGMFETNSSSSHCLVLNGPNAISKDLMDLNLPQNEKGFVKIIPAIYGDSEGLGGMGRRDLTTSYEKLNYLATHILCDLCYPWNKDEQKPKKQMLTKAVKEVTGLPLSWPGPDKFKGCIDGLNTDFEDEAFRTKGQLIQTIFNPNYIIRLNYWGDYQEDWTFGI